MPNLAFAPLRGGTGAGANSANLSGTAINPTSPAATQQTSTQHTPINTANRALVADTEDVPRRCRSPGRACQLAETKPTWAPTSRVPIWPGVGAALGTCGDKASRPCVMVPDDNRFAAA